MVFETEVLGSDDNGDFEGAWFFTIAIDAHKE